MHDILMKKKKKKRYHCALDKDDTRMNGFETILTWMWEFTHEWMNMYFNDKDADFVSGSLYIQKQESEGVKKTLWNRSIEYSCQREQRNKLMGLDIHWEIKSCWRKCQYAKW